MSFDEKTVRLQRHSFFCAGCTTLCLQCYRYSRAVVNYDTLLTRLSYCVHSSIELISMSSQFRYSITASDRLIFFPFRLPPGVTTARIPVYSCTVGWLQVQYTLTHLSQPGYWIRNRSAMRWSESWTIYLYYFHHIHHIHTLYWHGAVIRSYTEYRHDTVNILINTASKSKYVIPLY